jgi:transcriptional antiterminator NusG
MEKEAAHKEIGLGEEEETRPLPGGDAIETVGVNAKPNTEDEGTEAIGEDVGDAADETTGADDGGETEGELPPEELERLIELRVADPERPDLCWYVVHTLTGHEEKVRTSLLKSVQDSDLQNYFDEVLVPTEEVTKTTKKGKKTSRKVFFPGYILIRMVINEKTWGLVRGTPGVTGFVKTGTYPVPLIPDEIRVTLDQIEGRKPRVEYVVDFEPGESVKITSGPFAGFMAVVEDVYPERQKIKVLVTVFGRATSVELELGEVERAR